MIVCILINIDGVGVLVRRGVISLIGMGWSLYIMLVEIGIVVYFGKFINIIGMLIVVCREIIMFVKWFRFGCFILYIEIGKFCFFILLVKMLL